MGVANSERVLIAQILARHGARPDARLWRNASSLVYVGTPAGRTALGHLVLANARPIEAGLCVGSSDLVGIRDGGQFLGLEVKFGKTRLQERQERWLELIEKLGGCGRVVRSVEEVDQILGEPE